MSDNETTGVGVTPPPATLLHMMTGYWISQTLYVAAKLGIADLLTEGPTSVANLAAATDTDACSLYRVLRPSPVSGSSPRRLPGTSPSPRSRRCCAPGRRTRCARSPSCTPRSTPAPGRDPLQRPDR